MILTVRSNFFHISLLLQWLDRHEVMRRHPLVDGSDIEGGVWCGGDAVADPLAVCMALAIVARQQGTYLIFFCIK